MHARGELGRAGEAVAEAYLCARRHTVVARNWRCRLGELDLVTREGGTVVFVEVRSRRGDRLGTPLESVDWRKRARLVRLAQQFLCAHGWGDRPVRFDVVGVRFDTEPPRVEYVRGAFEAGG